MDKPRLTIELVPSTSWGDNLRSRLSRRDWDYLRKECYAFAGMRCEICARVGTRHPVECHEIWHYDDTRYVQTLKGLIALCPACHEVKHVGRAFAIGRGDQAVRHLQRVNAWSWQTADDYVCDAFAEHAWRSRKQWALDLSWLSKRGFQCIETV